MAPLDTHIEENATGQDFYQNVKNIPGLANLNSSSMCTLNKAPAQMWQE